MMRRETVKTLQIMSNSRHDKPCLLPCPPKHLYTPQCKGYSTLLLTPSAAELEESVSLPFLFHNSS